MHLDNVLIYGNKIDIYMKIDINGDIYIYENRDVCRYIDSVRYGDKNILRYIEINNFSNCVAC
jgi:hypothetical protein